MKVCCRWMDNLLGRAGEQGTSVVASREAGARRFLIQARPLTIHQADALHALANSNECERQVAPLFEDERGRKQAILTMMQVPLAYCRQCGTDLVRWVRERRPDFDRLAEIHRAFLD